MERKPAGVNVGLIAEGQRAEDLRTLIRAAGAIPCAGTGEVLLVDMAITDAADIRRHCDVPVIALVGPSRIAARRAAAAAGAADFLSDPATPDALAARLAALVGEPMSSPVVIEGDHARHGRRRMLPNAPARAILGLLIDAGGRVVRSEALIAAAWTAGDLNGPNKLRVAINGLRKGLENDPELPTLIVSEPGIGYRLGNGREAS